nr:odorant receptor Or2-like [Megalopta genalis]
MTSFVQLLMFTYSCDGLIQQSLNVATAVYSAPWTYLPMNKYGKMLRKDVVLVIQRSRVPCCLTAKGFFPVSLETYTKVWSTAASYFTLLTQTMDNLENT